MRVRVLSRREVEEGAAEGADVVISIHSPAAAGTAELDAALIQAVGGDVDALLTLRFDDIGLETFGPDLAQIADALAFARRVRNAVPEGVLAVHCEASRSRSPAISLAVLADGFGPGREAEAVEALLRTDTDGRHVPNPAVVRHADACLLRLGALAATLRVACPAYALAERHWHAVAADPEGHWREARRRAAVRRRRAGQATDHPVH